MKVNAFRNAATVALSMAFAGAVFAQGSPQSSPQPPTPQTPPTTAAPQQDTRQMPSGLRGMDGQTVTVTGCLMQEKNVAGQTPNPTERAGIAPDYILTNVQMRSASPGAAGAPGTPATPSTPPTTGAPGAAASAGADSPAGAGTNVKLKEVDNDQMRANLNKRIEVTGRFQAAPAPSGAVVGAAETVARGGGENKPLPEVHVTNVRVLNEPCTPQ